MSSAEAHLRLVYCRGRGKDGPSAVYGVLSAPCTSDACVQTEGFTSVAGLALPRSRSSLFHVLCVPISRDPRVGRPNKIAPGSRRSVGVGRSRRAGSAFDAFSARRKKSRVVCAVLRWSPVPSVYSINYKRKEAGAVGQFKLQTQRCVPLSDGVRCRWFIQ